MLHILLDNSISVIAQFSDTTNCSLSKEECKLLNEKKSTSSQKCHTTLLPIPNGHNNYILKH